MIDWGDGPDQPPEGTTTITTLGPNTTGTTLTYLGSGDWTFSATHHFDHANSTGTAAQIYSIGVTLTDDDTGVAAGAASVTVHNVVTLSIPTLTQALSGGIIQVPVILDAPSAPGTVLLSSAALAINFDINVLAVTSADVHLGEVLSTGWTLNVSTDSDTGQIGVTLFRPTPAEVASGNLILIDFHVKPTASLGLSRINLAATNVHNATPVATALASSGTPFVLRPLPTNSNSDAVDGSIIVAAPIQFQIETPANVTAGQEFSFTITALDPDSNPMPGYGGTVHFSASDANHLLPDDATLTDGVGVFTATLKTAGLQSLTATDTALISATETSAGILVASAQVAQLIVGSAAGITAGGPLLISVSARDAFNNLASGYTGTFQFTSSDAQASLPADSTLTGGLGFFAGILKTAGDQTVTVTDTLTSDVSADSGPIAVSAANATHIIISAPPSATAGQAFDVSIVARDAYQNTALAYAGTIQFTASDGSAALPPPSTLSNGVGTFNVVLKAPGSQSVIASDAVNAGITASAELSVAPTPVTHFSINAPGTMSAGGISIFQVSALNQFNQVVLDHSGVASFNVTDGQAFLPVSGSLTNGIGYFAFILRTAGGHTISAVDAATPSIVGTSNIIVVNASAAHHLGFSVPTGGGNGERF